MPDKDDPSGENPDGDKPSIETEGREATPADPAPAEPENRRARRAARATSRNKKSSRERQRIAETGLDAGERVDDALSRASDSSFRWIKEHFNIVQWLIVGGVAAWIGTQIYSWRSDKTAAKASDALSEAISADLGRIGAAADDDSDTSVDTRRSFATDEERVKAAKEGYEKVVAERPSPVAVSVAQLGLAGVLYDEGKYDDAKKLYDDVASSELAKLDPEAKGRSVEGSGLSLEAKGDKDGALKRFGELENLDVSGYRELALFHQARLLHEKGDDDGAKQRLKKVVDKLGKEKDKEATALDSHGYLLESARALLERIDPKAAPPPSSDEALRRAIEQFQKKLPGGVTQMPMPVPAAP